MAKKNETQAAGTVGDFDYSAFVPAGGNAKDLRTIGGFTPIYAPEEALDDSFPPAGGYLRCFEILPAVKVGKEMYIPKMISMIVTNDTKGVRGPKDAREVIDVPKTKRLLIPLTGNLLNNQELIDAVADPKNVHWAIFRVTGTQDTGQPTPMFVWDVKLLDTLTIKREGEYALPVGGTGVERVLGTGETSTGEVYDTKTGELVGKAGSASASA